MQISAAVVPTALPLPDSYQPASSLLFPVWSERAAISVTTPVTTSAPSPATSSYLKSLTNAEKYLALRSLKRKSADLDRDGLPDSQDPDDDNDGIADTEDAFPRLANEWLDTDGDGIGNNADADDDNDGVPDDLDALPLDATENKDSDGDGKGDNSDAYPNDAACDKTSNGNGQICYLTMLKDVANDDIHLDKQGLLHILAREQQQIFRLNTSTGDFLPAVTFRTPVDNPKLLNVRYAPELDQVFVVVDNKAIYAYQPEVGVLDLLMAFEYLDPVLEITGRYLLIHYYPGYQILDPVTKRLNECYSNVRMSNMRWESVQQRLYYETVAIDPKDIESIVINQQTGQCESLVELPYHGDFDIKGPIRLSKDGKQMLLGTGHLFSTENLTWQGRFPLTELQDAVIRDGQTWLVRNGTLEIFDSEQQAIAYLPKAGHQAFGLRDMADKLLVLSRKPQQLSWYFHRSSDQPDDSDGDGVVNLLDAFPADPAAAVDNDFDGAPDHWLPGKTAANSNTGLQLDAFPTESLCFAAAHGVNGLCDRERLMPLFEPDQTAYDNDGTLYLFHREHRFIYRWSAATGKFLNPIPLAQLQLQPTASTGVRLELPASFLLDAANQQIYLHYQRGSLTRLSLLDGKEQPFMRYPLATKPLLAGSYLLLQRYDEKGFYNQFDIFNHQGQLLSSAMRQNAATAVLHDAVQHKLWITDLDTTANTIDPTDSLIRCDDFSLDGVVGSVNMAFLDQYPWSSVDLGNQLSFSPQGQITTGNGWFINNTQPPSLDRSKLHLELGYLPDAQHYWFDATLVQVGYDARIFSSESYQQLHQIDLQLPMSSAVRFPYQHDLVELRQLDGRYQATYHWISDRDGDGIPGWWEQKYGLNNDDPLDAAGDLDQDGLNNLEEFNVGADPTALDSDGDGLSDFDEVRQYRTHPGKLDSDQDTIPDGDEVNFGMDPTTDDRFSDVDQDGHYNLEEIEFGSLVNNVDSVPLAPGWLTAQGDNQRRAYVPLVLQPENFSFKWQFTTPQRMVGLAVHEQQLALTTVAANNAAASLQLRNSDNGTVNWQQSFSNPGNTATSPMISAPAIDAVGRVFLNANYVEQSMLYDMHSYDLQNGQLLWRNTSTVAQNYNSQAPLMQDNTLYLAGSNFKAFNADNGALLWSTLYLTGSWSAAVAGEQLLFVASDDGANCRPFRLVAPSDGYSYNDWTCTDKQRSDIAANTMPIYPQWGSDNRALLTVGDGVVSKSLASFYKRDWFKTDQISSGLDAKKQIHSSLAPGLVFMVRQNRLWQLDSETGAEHWQWTPPAGKTLIRAVVATSSHVFVSSQDTTYAIDRKTQTMVWSYPKSGKLAVDKQQLLLIQGEKELTAITLGQ